MLRDEDLKILGLDNNATKKDIKKAYIELSKQIHPDKHEKSSYIRELTEMQQILNIVYDRLSKDAYDSNSRSLIFGWRDLLKRVSEIEVNFGRRKNFFDNLFILFGIQNGNYTIEDFTNDQVKNLKTTINVLLRLGENGLNDVNNFLGSIGKPKSKGVVYIKNIKKQ